MNDKWLICTKKNLFPYSLLLKRKRKLQTYVEFYYYVLVSPTSWTIQPKIGGLTRTVEIQAILTTQCFPTIVSL
jgi:hypothetical protein